jgi:hypothetical protein
MHQKGPRRLALLVVVVALLVAAPAAFAAKGGGGGGGKGGGGTTSGGTSSMTLVLMNSSDGLPHWGQDVRFDVKTTATSEPHVDLTCSQNGTLVYSGTTGYYASYPWPWTQTFTLSSQSWTGGDADCSAVLYSMTNSGTKTTLSSLKFHVYA